MGEEATITINGIMLDEEESMVMRVAIVALAEISIHQLEYNAVKNRVSEKCRTDIHRVQAMMDERRYRKH